MFNPPPGWPKPPDGWRPPAGWTPDPSWPDPPEGWQLWIPTSVDSDTAPPTVATQPEAPPPRETTGAGLTGELVAARLAVLEAENAALRAQLEAAGDDADEIVILDDERVLQSVGIYRYHHPLENAVAYKDRLDDLATRIAQLVKSGAAIERSNMFTFDNSLAKGRRMTGDLSKLMLRAYNAEADNSIRSLRVGNVVTAKRRLEASRTAIAKLGKMMEMRISDAVPHAPTRRDRTHCRLVDEEARGEGSSP